MRVLILFSLLITTSLFAQQAADTLWTKTYGGSGNDEALSVCQTDDGGFIIVGTTASFDAGVSDIWLIKTNESGEEEWNRTFGGDGEDRGTCGQQTTDGGYIIAGTTQSNAAGVSNIWLIKTDAGGDELWSNTFGGNADDLASSVKQTGDGGYVIVGLTESYSTGLTDVWLVKTDENGNEEWSRSYGGQNYDNGFSVQQTLDGGYIIAGTTESYGAGLTDIWIIKTDEDGMVEWDQTFGGTSVDVATSVQQTSDEGFIIAGNTLSYGAGLYDVWLIKTDEDGNEQWSQTYGGSNFDVARSVEQVEGGGYIVAGFSKSFSNGENDVYIIRVDEAGEELWHKTYGGEEDDIANSIQQTSDGGFIVAGYTNSFGQDSKDVWLLRLSSEINDADEDVLDMKYNINNYPNPFNPKTTFSFSLPTNGKAELNIYNIRGQLVKHIDDKWLAAGDHKVTWFGDDNAGNPLGSGVYIVCLKVDDINKATRKVLLMK